MAKPKVRRRPPLPEQKGKENLPGAKTPSLNPPVLTLCISLVLVVTILCIFWQLRNHEFINLDDDEYVANNARVDSGLTASGAAWAFVTMHAANWHPLTMLSLLADSQFSLKDSKGQPGPALFHLTNMVLHCASSFLLFWVLQRMTGCLWRSGWVAALFALHPLHVESVAWVAERKDVLSGLFWMLAILTYVRFVEGKCGHSPFPASSTGERLPESMGVERNKVHISRSLLLVCLMMGLGLLAKPMLVTLPVVFLLLDFWPLGRFSVSDFSLETGAIRRTWTGTASPAA